MLLGVSLGGASRNGVAIAGSCDFPWESSPLASSSSVAMRVWLMSTSESVGSINTAVASRREDGREEESSWDLRASSMAFFAFALLRCLLGAGVDFASVTACSEDSSLAWLISDALRLDLVEHARGIAVGGAGVGVSDFRGRPRSRFDCCTAVFDATGSRGVSALTDSTFLGDSVG